MHVMSVLATKGRVFWLSAAFVLSIGAAFASGTEHSALMAFGGSADVDGDGDVDLDDYRYWQDCMAGPGQPIPPEPCVLLDFDRDNDIDLADFKEFQLLFNPPTPPAGNLCSGAVGIFNEGLFSFSNATATRDGPAHAACSAGGQDQIANDVWRCWNSPCTGMVVVDTCGLTTIDTKIAVYSGCTCPATTARLVGCNDDASCGVQARVTFQALLNNNYLIRIGSYPGTPGGTGSIRITCGFDACPNAAASCFEPHTGTGCSETNCCNTVCAADSFCCESEWDDFCVEEAEGLCEGGFSSCGAPLTPDCQTQSALPGCSDANCCNEVCRVDTSCCLVAWDNFCAELHEPSICRTACDTSTESCFQVHASPGCNNDNCCAEVCPRDPFCCSSEWDEACVELAIRNCF